jgi:poly-beta-1,6-N-acetyl-D-glucosamine synthase
LGKEGSGGSLFKICGVDSVMLFNLYEAITHHPYWQVFLTLLFIGYVFATMVQIWIYGYFFNRFSKYKEPENKLKTSQEPFSIIICARNEAENLQKNLPSILNQSYTNFEVIVVDDDSTDNSLEILSAFEQQYPHLCVKSNTNKQRAGKKDALAAGIAAASHNNLLMTDADCSPASSLWLQAMSERLTDHTKIVLGFGPYIERKGILNKWIRFEAIHTALQYFSFSLVGMPYMGVGRNIAWKKNLFDIIGGFEAHEHIASGDDDLFVSAASTPDNTTICILPDAFVYSAAKKTWSTYFKQKRRHLSTGWHYRWEHQILLAIGSLSHTLHYFAFVLLVFFGFGTVFVFVLYIIRILTVIRVFLPTLHKLRANNLIPFLPILDAALAGYYVVFSPILFLHTFKIKGHTWN